MEKKRLASFLKEFENIPNNAEEKKVEAGKQVYSLVRGGSEAINNGRALDWYPGSMRREREWKRTLACKIFEERQSVAGDEGMDLLWETFEVESNDKNLKKKKKKKKSEIEYYDEEEEGVKGQLCCLQALKLSSGKVNLGMGRPNLVKISKAIKGIGWLHHMTRQAWQKRDTN